MGRNKFILQEMNVMAQRMSYPTEVEDIERKQEKERLIPQKEQL